MINAEVFINAAGPTAILAQFISAVATEIKVSSTANFPVLAEGEQCRFVIQDTVVSPIEMVLAVGPSSGNVFTVLRGQEGTTATVHVYGALVSPVITAYHLGVVFPRPPRVVTDPDDAEIRADDQIVIIDLDDPEPCTVTADPASLIPGKVYNLSSAMNQAVTLQSSDETVVRILTVDTDSLDFFTDGTTLRGK